MLPMITGVELTQGIWLFHSSEAGRNYGIALSETGGALLVDPVLKSTEAEAVGRFLAEQGRSLHTIVLTAPLRTQDEAADLTILDRWPQAARITPEAVAAPIHVAGPEQGWQVVPLRPGVHTALYNPGKRILFPGRMLGGGPVPVLMGESRSYMSALEVVAGMDVKLLVPTSGQPAQGRRAVRQRVQHERQYVSSLRMHIISAILSEATLERVLGAAASVYADYPFVQDHLHNLRIVWHELHISDDTDQNGTGQDR
jgi:glyoxylase-like metal-dependent hydrolase (beta-lactamase superfamily II)